MRRVNLPHTTERQVADTSVRRQRLVRLQQAVHDMTTDPRRAERLVASECVVCFYTDNARIGGCAMTTWNCGLCGAEAVHSSTATPKLCQPCGTTHTLCVQCGADRELRARRRTWATPAATVPLTDTSDAD